ncbi:MAG TPA: sodium ion-translocating decarboxylase subunit beta [Clostridia bacterium]|nr:sodium ion-translocating decarboxylase subunit beta [Clostridia bacterium]
MLSSLISASLGEAFQNLWKSTGIANAVPEYYIANGYKFGIWGMFLMLIIACVLVYLAIVKKFEPNLLLAIAFGMFVINIPGAYNVLYGITGYTFTDSGTGTVIASGTLQQLCETFNVVYNNTDATTLNESLRLLQEAVTAHVGTGSLGNIVMTSGIVAEKGLFYYLYKGVDWVIFPPIIFLGIGAMTDFGPLIANPRSLLLGAAAQIGIFITFFGALFLGFNEQASSAIAIIGGADGPTAIYLTQKMANSTIGTMYMNNTMDLLPAIAIAAYSYMALVPVIQPPIMKLLTTKKERLIRMEQLRPVSKREKIIFPILVTALTGIFLPAAIPLLGMLMLGNLIKESGVVPRLSNTAQNELLNIITIFLGLVVGSKAFAPIFLSTSTLSIVLLGVIAFSFGTASGVLLGKLMCKLSGGKINPLIGAAGVSAVPMAARVAQDVGRKEDPNNYLLMHAMGPNVAGVIGSAVAAGVLLSMFGN